MSKRFLSGTLAVVLSAGLVAAACGGDDDTGGSPAATSTPASDRTPAQQQSPTTPSATRQAESGSSTIPDELRSVAEAYTRATFTSTYEITQDTGKGTLTLAQDGKKSYIGIESAQGGFIIITTDQNTFTCFKAGTTGFCSRQAPDPSFEALDFRQSLDSLQEGASTYKRLDDRKIAGFDSACWQVTGTSSFVLCVAKKEKILTAIQYDQQGGASITLKQYSDKVDAKLFEPPFPVQ
ncbi:hypothetical protein [Tepidiforma sp.]|uniref:hypothetical protein n=1 Tax=Tepidiforma sp. TaxID=2682230 RepID=UPI002ADDA38D|nr:hypothetical protein [Tepidiforma sp.]